MTTRRPKTDRPPEANPGRGPSMGETDPSEEPEAKHLAGDAKSAPVTALAGLPGWFPDWARTLAELYFSGTTNMFVLHGNTFDFTRVASGDTRRFGSLAEFIAEQLFGRWDLVLHYDLARGLRCLAGGSSDRLRQMVATATRLIGDLKQLRAPTKTLAVLDLFLTKNIMADPKKRIDVAIVFDHASYLVPAGDRATIQDKTHQVTLLNWATSPYMKRINAAFVLIDQSLAAVSERLSSNPHVAAIDVPLPAEPEREEFLSSITSPPEVAKLSDYTIPQIARLTAGISLTDLNVLVQSSLEAGRRLDHDYFQVLKKRLIERQAQGLLEFLEPTWGLDMVVGHDAAKQRLRDDAALLKQGRLESVPMGYLFCGPVGTGKSFLAQCATGTIGIPCVKLKNFRSKYVGETETNLERVLTVLRSMGPVVVMIDEADAMLGDRESGSGDSGVNARVFGMIASQMGDTRYRGRILWILMTARPDLLPVDIKRQGRAEVHVPLFYPTEDEEVRKMFMVLAKKAGASLDRASIPEVIPNAGHLSGADIEGIIGRAWRTSLLAGAAEITAEALAGAVEGFMPSTQSLERELQELAAIIECTDQEFLPPAKIEKMNALGGRQKLQERLNAIKQIIG
jgi:AAA+ superfamily predicted ATPase